MIKDYSIVRTKKDVLAFNWGDLPSKLFPKGTECCVIDHFTENAFLVEFEVFLNGKELPTYYSADMKGEDLELIKE